MISYTELDDKWGQVSRMSENVQRFRIEMEAASRRCEFLEAELADQSSAAERSRR
jgi:hypothetical protein